MMSSIINFFKPGKKNRKRLTYEDFIIAAACNNPAFTITAANNIEIVKTLPMEKGTYAAIAENIKQGNIAQVIAMQTNENLLEELTLVQFTNQAGKPFAAVIYDAYDAWEHPVVVEIFGL